MLGWKDDVKMALVSREMTVEARDNARKIGNSGEHWCMCDE